MKNPSSAGIGTHDPLNTSLFPLPLDEDSRPTSWHLRFAVSAKNIFYCDTKLEFNFRFFQTHPSWATAWRQPPMTSSTALSVLRHPRTTPSTRTSSPASLCQLQVIVSSIPTGLGGPNGLFYNHCNDEKCQWKKVDNLTNVGFKFLL